MTRAKSVDLQEKGGHYCQKREIKAGKQVDDLHKSIMHHDAAISQHKTQ